MHACPQRVVFALEQRQGFVVTSQAGRNYPASQAGFQVGEIEERMAVTRPAKIEYGVGSRSSRVASPRPAQQRCAVGENAAPDMT